MILPLLAALLALPARGLGDGPPGTVLVPGGRTRIGTEVAELERLILFEPEARAFAGALSAETPRHEADVASFWLMATEVTNEQFAVYVRASGARPPEPWAEARIGPARARHQAEQESLRAQALASGRPAPEPVPFDARAWWRARWNAPGEARGADGPGWEVPPREGALPVVFVDWQDARGYARWAGLRLMSEIEYQRAVRGDSTRNHPWGNEWEDGKRAATGHSEKRTGAFPVGSFPEGASAQGALDLAGNVWEWTSSPYLPFPGYEARLLEVGYGPARRTVNALADWNGEQRVVVGGSFQNGRLMARASTRRSAERAQAADALGFRCAASLRPGLDAAAAILETELTANARPRSARRMVEYAPELVVCADGWASAKAGTIAVSAGGVDGSWTPPASYAVIAGYRRVLFTPVREVLAHDPRGLEKLTASDDLVPLGFLSTNLAVLEPELAAGTYMASWRGKGVRPFSARSEGSADGVPLEEALAIDVTRDNLILVDLAGRPALALPCKLEWTDARESRATWVDPASVPQTGGATRPEGCRILRLDVCVPCRIGRSFAFALTLVLAPDELGVGWRPR